jgi:hypothetical protein
MAARNGGAVRAATLRSTYDERPDWRPTARKSHPAATIRVGDEYEAAMNAARPRLSRTKRTANISKSPPSPSKEATSRVMARR